MLVQSNANVVTKVIMNPIVLAMMNTNTINAIPQAHSCSLNMPMPARSAKLPRMKFVGPKTEIQDTSSAGRVIPAKRVGKYPMSPIRSAKPPRIIKKIFNSSLLSGVNSFDCHSCVQLLQHSGHDLLFGSPLSTILFTLVLFIIKILPLYFQK